MGVASTQQLFSVKPTVDNNYIFIVLVGPWAVTPSRLQDDEEQETVRSMHDARADHVFTPVQSITVVNCVSARWTQ
jgi:hypothetical protein